VRRAGAALALLLLGGPAGGALASCPDRDTALRLHGEAGALLSGSKTDAALAEADALLRRALARCAEHRDARLLASQVCWETGDRLPRPRKEERKAWFAKGEAMAEEALKADARSAAAIFWRTANRASRADMDGWASSLWMFPGVRSEMQRVEDLEPHFYYGAVARFWSTVLTRIPLFVAGTLGHSVDEVSEALEREIRLEPRFFTNYTYAARLYRKAGDEARALELLHLVLSTDPGILPEERGENRYQQEQAARMWETLTGRTFPQR
jgi:tetratricopeptide (TPR) repeat protein